MPAPQTAKFRISRFVAFEASGSDISNPNAINSGYAPHLAEELARLGYDGGTAHLTAEDLRDLAEWLDAMEDANAQGGNHSGARSCRTTAEKARALAKELEAQ